MARVTSSGMNALPPAPGHFVEFYEVDETLIDHLSNFVRRGMSAGEPVVLIIGALHLEQLELAAPDVRTAIREAKITVLDARATLDRLLVEGSPSAERFGLELGTRMMSLSAGNRRICAYGEMVDLLWRDGNPRGALELEALWNGICARCDMTLMCAYNKSNFFRDSPNGESIVEVCRVHDHVVPAQRVTPAPLIRHD